VVTGRRKQAAASAGLAIIYVMAGRLGLMMDPVGGFATLVWPPAGIALAALLLFGLFLWPCVAAGALLVNLWAGAPVLTATGIALGNTLESLVVAHALRSIPGFTLSLSRVKDVLALALLAACGGAVAATIGAGTLRMSGVIESAAFGGAWRAWWFGDAIGMVIVAPLILVWWTQRAVRIQRARLAEAVVDQTSTHSTVKSRCSTRRSGDISFTPPISSSRSS
jgi:integral membrane sensor domain MASE1